MKKLLLLIAIVCANALQVLAVETNAYTRDPSSVIKRGNTYWVYGTGSGIQQFSSTDRVNWTSRGPLFATVPAWAKAAVPENKGDIMWAPDVRFMNGKYYLYYVFSAFGTQISVIGLATSTDLQPNNWVDQGMVVRTTRADNYNAIDPCIFQDAQGKPWLAFGSYFSGIKLMPLDGATGKQLANSQLTSIATRPGVPGNAIEAAEIYYRNGFYYLFVNWDACCAGAKSSYNIRVGRSREVTGPYLDKSGKDMMQGGGTLFLNAIYDNGSGRLIDDRIGPGHVGILQDTDGFWVSTHAEWSRAQNGRANVNLNRLSWDSDGWPRAVLDAGPHKIVSNVATHGVATIVPGAEAVLQTTYNQNLPTQNWLLAHQGDGFYSLTNVGAGGVLTVAGDGAASGAKMQIAPFQKRDTQLWQLQPNEDGTYTLLSKSSRNAAALDIGNCLLTDGAAVGQWTSNGLDCQKWSFRAR